MLLKNQGKTISFANILIPFPQRYKLTNSARDTSSPPSKWIPRQPTCPILPRTRNRNATIMGPIIHNSRLRRPTHAIKPHPRIRSIELPACLNLFQLLQLPFPALQPILHSPHESNNPTLIRILDELHPLPIKRLMRQQLEEPVALAGSG